MFIFFILAKTADHILDIHSKIMLHGRLRFPASIKSDDQNTTLAIIVSSYKILQISYSLRYKDKKMYTETIKYVIKSVLNFLINFIFPGKAFLKVIVVLNHFSAFGRTSFHYRGNGRWSLAVPALINGHKCNEPDKH